MLNGLSYELPNRNLGIFWNDYFHSLNKINVILRSNDVHITYSRNPHHTVRQQLQKSKHTINLYNKKKEHYRQWTCMICKNEQICGFGVFILCVCVCIIIIHIRNFVIDKYYMYVLLIFSVSFLIYVVYSKWEYLEKHNNSTNSL